MSTLDGIWSPVLSLTGLKTGTGSPLSEKEGRNPVSLFSNDTVESGKSEDCIRYSVESLRLWGIFILSLSLSLSLSLVTRVKIQNII